MRVISVGARDRHVPRGVDPGLVPAAPHVLAVLEHVLRRRPLRRHARRVHRAVHPAPAGLPAAPQHARGDDRGRDRRLRVLPADAAATPRRAVPGAGAERRGRVRRCVHPFRPARRGRIRLRRHPCRVRRPVVVRLRGDGVDLEPVRGDAEPAHRLVGVVRRSRCGRCCAGGGAGSPGCCIRSPRCSASS